MVVDVFYDHFLALRFDRYHAEPIQAFADRVYALLQRRRDDLPEASRRFLDYMTYENILPRYATLPGIDQVLKGLDRRTRFDSGMDRAVEALRADYDAYSEDFERFFPALQKHVAADVAEGRDPATR